MGTAYMPRRSSARERRWWWVRNVAPVVVAVFGLGLYLAARHGNPWWWAAVVALGVGGVYAACLLWVVLAYRFGHVRGVIEGRAHSEAGSVPLHLLHPQLGELHPHPADPFPGWHDDDA